MSSDVPSCIPDSIPGATPSPASCVLQKCVVGKKHVEREEEVKLWLRTDVASWLQPGGHELALRGWGGPAARRCDVM